MSWDYRVDKEGCLKIEVSRWNNAPPPEGMGTRVVLLIASGFEPNEPVSVEILTQEDG